MICYEFHDSDSEKGNTSNGGSNCCKSLRCRQLFEHSSDAIFITDNCQIIDANQAAARMANLDAESLIGLRTSSFFVDVTDLERIRQSYLETGFIRDCLVRMVMPDGREFDCELSGSASIADDGTINSQMIVQDVTQQPRAESAVSEREDRFRRLARQNEVLASIGQIISSTMDIEDVFDRFADEMGSLVRCDSTVIGLVDTDAKALIPKYQIGDTGPYWKVGQTVSLDSTTPGQVVVGGATVSGPGEALESNDGDQGGNERCGSMLLAPLKTNNEVFGVLGLFCTEPNAYAEVDEKFVELVADQIAGAVANAQLYDRLRAAEELQTHLAEESAIMAEVGRVVSSSLDLNDVYERFAESVRFLLPFDRISISLVDLGTQSSTQAYFSGMAHPISESTKPRVGFGTLSGQVVHSRQGVIVQGRDWDVHDADVQEYSKTLKSLIAVPLVADTKVIGLMYLSAVEEEAYTPRDLEVAQRVGAQVAGVLAITQLYAQQRETESLLRATAFRVQHQSAELSYTNSDLLKANKVKSEFLSHMSHELRTPLNAVLGFADLLTESAFGSLSERQNRFVENITTAGNHLLRLINDTLELSKIQDGLLKLRVGPVRVERCVEQSVKSIQSKRRDVSVTMEVNVPEGRVFYGDERRLSQIVLCLLDNAVKFSSADGHVGLHAWASEDALHISVKDSGMGIHEKYHQQIFDLFDQGHPSVGKKYGGSGLGLALVKQLVDLHEGYVNVESSEGEGSVFDVRLPYRQDVEASESEQRKMWQPGQGATDARFNY